SGIWPRSGVGACRRRCGGSGRAEASVGHVSPRSRGRRERERQEELVDRLGNPLLLPEGANERLGDRDPQDKAEDYAKSGSLVAREVAEALNRPWTEKAIAEREERLLDWAKRAWGD
ncbi:MAG: DUF1524 domain-containing protein, partial [Oscillatoriaceae bacterium SKYG93]|nr:DUF1524 domain-containing protein [Oscillatoriaceae bacterium SKYG93]MDW8451851.1 DUF1524 domain-containing protein [Oscillatoriaceae cyanobacterium SKYGB_i_bin93]